MKVYLGLGSNQGDRKQNLTRVLAILDDALGCHYESLSDFYQTKSWGFEGPDFLNAAVCYDLVVEDPQKDGLRILDICKDAERQLGRTGEPEYDCDGKRIYRDRPVDVDILLIGNCTIDSPRLKVPHPQMEERDFVMIPLRQILK